MWIVASSQSTSRPSIQIFFTGSIGIPSSSVWVSGRRTGPRGEVRGLAAAQGYRLPSAPARKARAAEPERSRVVLDQPLGPDPVRYVAHGPCLARIDHRDSPEEVVPGPHVRARHDRPG